MIFLGIDCGTQGTKVSALDWDTGEIIASAQRGYGFLPDLPPGTMEQNPLDWRNAASEGIAEVVHALGARRGEVAGIGVGGQQHGLVVLNDQGEVVRPAKLWCDLSTRAQSQEITAHFGGEAEIIRLVGNTMRPGYTAPKILWLRQHEPENWKAARRFLLPHDYLNFWLTGEQGMEFGDASGTALLDVKERCWSRPLLDFLGEEMEDRLPPLQSSRGVAGVLRESLRAQWGLPSGVIVSTGGGDNMMAAIGTGNIREGVVTASLGTSGTLYAFSKTPVVDPSGGVAAFCDSTDHWLPLVCIMNITLVTEHVRNLFGWNHAQFEAAARSVPAGADGLTLIPYLTGERTPDLPTGTGVLHGLTLQNFSPAALARAAMEGTTLGLGYGLKRLKELGITPSEIRLTGGGSHSPLWQQLCTDVFGVPTVRLEIDESVSLGAAIQAGWAWGRKDDLPALCERFVKVDETSRLEPISSNQALYAERLERTHRLVSTLSANGFL